MDTETQNFLDYIKTDNDIKYELIPVCDDFKNFLNGLTLNTEVFTYIGFYEKNTKNVYFILQSVNKSPEVYTTIYNAWQLFHNNDFINVKFYDKYSGQYDKKSCDYETERKYLYKYLMNIYIDNLLVDSRCYNT
jgi:hypothetical protein